MGPHSASVTASISLSDFDQAGSSAACEQYKCAESPTGARSVPEPPQDGCFCAIRAARTSEACLRSPRDAIQQLQIVSSVPKPYRRGTVACDRIVTSSTGDEQSPRIQI